MPTPSEIIRRLDTWGSAKAALSFERLSALGLLAGLFIGLGGAFFAMAVTGSALGIGPTRVLGGVVFSSGLVLVVFTGAELSTGNCLLVVPWLAGRVSSRALLRNWGLSFLSNAVGAVLLALLVSRSGLLRSDDLRDTVRHIVEAKVALPFGEAFVRGILCNMLVCLAIWMSFTAPTALGKILTLALPIAAFVALGFEHSIANLFLLPLGISGGAQANVIGVLSNLVPVALGNLVGGAGLGMVLALVHRK
jgi:formate/nitrite transporter